MLAFLACYISIALKYRARTAQSMRTRYNRDRGFNAIASSRCLFQVKHYTTVFLLFTQVHGTLYTLKIKSAQIY